MYLHTIYCALVYHMTHDTVERELFNIGDKVRYKRGFNGINLEVSSVNCLRCVVERVDSRGNSWFRHADMDELEILK